MRQLLLIVAFLVIVFDSMLSQESALQTRATTDSIFVSKVDIIEAANKIESLQQDRQLHLRKIDLLTSQVVDLQTLNTRTQSIMELRDEELKMYRGFVTTFVGAGMPDQKEKWYQTKTFHFITGAIAASTAIWVGGTLAAKFQ